jgi:putative endonuclease
MTYFIYILECKNGSFYTGYTTDMERRYQEHLQGSTKCKYTRSFPPKRIAACWQVNASLSKILKIENGLKKLTKVEKIRLTREPLLLKILFKIRKCSSYSGRL